MAAPRSEQRPSPSRCRSRTERRRSQRIGSGGPYRFQYGSICAISSWRLLASSTGSALASKRRVPDGASLASGGSREPGAKRRTVSRPLLRGLTGDEIRLPDYSSSDCSDRVDGATTLSRWEMRLTANGSPRRTSDVSTAYGLGSLCASLMLQ